MGSQLGDDELKELPSKKKYATFHNNDLDCEDAYFYNRADFPLKQELWLNNVSKEIYKALCYIYKKSKTEGFNRDDCDYLYYWLNDIIYRNITFQLHSIGVIDVLNFLLQSNDGLKICYNNIYNVDKDNYMDIKLLFDFSKDYDTLKNYFSNGNRFCNKAFQNYVYAYIIKYNEFKDKCNKSNNSEATCIVFKKYFKDRENENLSNWTCNSAGNTEGLASSEKNHKTLEELFEPEVVPRIESQENSQEETFQREEQGGRRVVEHEISKYQDGEKHIIADQGRFTGSKSTNSYVHIGHSALSPIIDDPINSSEFTVSKAMTIASLIIGITVFSILFYRFTPFGYWVKKVLLGKSKRKRNIIMDRNIIEDYMIPEDLGSPRRFNLTYSNI